MAMALSGSGRYDVPYKIMVPKKGTGANLLVPVTAPSLLFRALLARASAGQSVVMRATLSRESGQEGGGSRLARLAAPP